MEKKMLKLTDVKKLFKTFILLYLAWKKTDS